MSFLAKKMIATTVASFCKSSNTPPLKLISSPPLLIRCFSSWKSCLLPTVSPFRASLISRCSFSVTSRSTIDVALDSVVKIFSVSSTPDLARPWQKSEEQECTGSGFIISRRRILTNAHVVENHAYVQVRKHGSTTRYKANVEAVGHECDLALLAIDSEEFWEDMNPLELGDVPFIDETVSVLGYPLGGDTISVTKGIVSRVESTKYAHSSTNLLTVQIDAAINNGNSGGPVVMGDKVAGVAFQGHSYSENTGYIIPTPVVKHFLSGVEESGQYVGFGSLDILFQPMNHVQIRKHFKMSCGMTGIIVNKTNPLSGAHKILKKDDIILAIDGVSIGNDGTVVFRGKELISFDHMVSMKKPYETALFKVLRDGREHEFNIILNSVQPLVPVRQLVPSYYMLAGFVFVPLSEPYIDESYSISDSAALKRKSSKKAGEQIVIISQVLLTDINIDYRDFKDLQVKKVNGVEVVNLKHLCQLIEKCRTEYLRLDLEDERLIILDYKSAKEATSLILERDGIRSAMSKDLKKVRRLPKITKKKQDD